MNVFVIIIVFQQVHVIRQQYLLTLLIDHHPNHVQPSYLLVTIDAIIIALHLYRPATTTTVITE